jgi:GGDEF domain-containing protein
MLDSFGIRALAERLATSERRIVFLVGSGISTGCETAGIASTAEFVELVRAELQPSPETVAEFESCVAGKSNPYQAAFAFLLHHRGPNAVAKVVRAGVLKAYAQPKLPIGLTYEDAEKDIHGWSLTPALESLGLLVASCPEKFGRCLLTTNFDPLGEIAIRRAGGIASSVCVDSDGGLGQREGDGCQVVHLHGHWLYGDTLHTSAQLTWPRPRLAAALRELLKETTLVVMAYGGWDDVFSQALVDVLAEARSGVELLWTFRGEYLAKEQAANPRLFERLSSGLSTGRALLYTGVDANAFLPNQLEPRLQRELDSKPGRTALVAVSPPERPLVRILPLPIKTAFGKEPQEAEAERLALTEPSRHDGSELEHFEEKDAYLLVTAARDLAWIGLKIRLSDPLLIGRGDDVQLRLPWTEVSRKHTRVVRRLTKWVISDLGSSNGTFVNSRRIQHPVALNDNDRVRIGGVVLTFMSARLYSVAAPLLDELHRRRTMDPLGIGGTRELADNYIAGMCSRQEGGVAVFLHVLGLERQNAAGTTRAGDELLKGILTIARNAIEGDEILCRYRGPRFVIICPGSEARAASASERVLNRIIEGVVELDLEGQQLSVQTGVSPIGAGPATSLDALFDVAFRLAPPHQPSIDRRPAPVSTDVPGADSSAAVEPPTVVGGPDALLE